MDNCGKSTTIEKIMKFNKNTKQMLIHCAKPPTGVDQNWSHEYYTSLLSKAKELNDSGWDIYFDRAHIGECVYGSMYRSTAFHHALEIESELNINEMHDVRLLVLVGTTDGLFARDDGKSISTEQFSQERTLFYNAFKQSVIGSKTFIDVDSDNFAALDEYIENAIEHTIERTIERTIENTPEV